MAKQVHELKTWPDAFQGVESGRKLFEWRRDDRLYAVGDQLKLYEYCPQKKEFTGRLIRAEVTWKTSGRFGVPPGYCVLGIRLMFPTHPVRMCFERSIT